MKLNYKRTILVGFVFFLICTFWQAYDTIIPKILTDKFGMSQAYSGIIMALDNVLALFMLPLFGALSDRVNTRLGRRTPFILIGTIIASIAFVGLTYFDNLQLNAIKDVSAIDSSSSLEVLYDNDYGTVHQLLTPDGEAYDLKALFTRDEFASITTETVGTVNSDGTVEIFGIPTDGSKAPDSAVNLYTNYVVPARQAYAWQKTVSNPQPLILFIAVLLVVLIAMATFRSPAVALMPDVTIKPLRSKANAIINLLGTAGGIIVLVLGMVFATSSAANSLMSYTTFFAVISGIMLAALIIFMLTVREPKYVADMKAESEKYGIDESAVDEKTGEKRKLTKGEAASLFFILASVVFWFMGYNAVTSKYSVYAPNVLNLSYNTTLLIANAAAIVSYLPVGMIASKVGRKKTILVGVVMLCAAFAVASFLRAGSSPVIMNCMFALAGIGWATINVNSFPMVVELAREGDIGKYTGFYYTASMAAQTLTPYFSGQLMDSFGMTTLFPYAAIAVAFAFVTMLFVRHGDNKPTAAKGIEAFDVDD